VLLATYPNDYTALTNSALLHKQQGDREEAIRKLELATQVAPDQPLAWGNLGQAYFERQQYAEARRVMENAIKLQDSTSARVGLYQVAILTGDLPLAEQQIAAVRGRRDEIDMVTIRLLAATYRGRMREAGELATDLQVRALALSRPATAGNGVMQLAISEALVGLGEQAQARAEKADTDGILNADMLDDRLVVAAIVRNAATAREITAELAEQKKSAGVKSPEVVEAERAVQALLLLAESKPADALKLLEPVSFDASHTDVVNLWTIAKMLVGDLPAAAKGLNFLVSSASRGGLSSTLPYAYAMLARVQSQMGQLDEARKSYQKFFDLYKDADPDVPLLVTAREEFVRLR
jgi:tetratricopeptide (TPR) repeat protein